MFVPFDAQNFCLGSCRRHRHWWQPLLLCRFVELFWRYWGRQHSMLVPAGAGRRFLTMLPTTRRLCLYYSFGLCICFIFIQVLQTYLGQQWRERLYLCSRKNPTGMISTTSSAPVTSRIPPTSPSFTNAALDDVEVRALQELIKWPLPPGNVTFNSSTNPQNCDYYILHPKAHYSVGEPVEVFLSARDHLNRPKTYGGDFFRAKLHSPKLKAGITGSVKDHQNGTYTFTFLLAWPGDVEVYIMLIHSSEAVLVMHRFRHSWADKINFNGFFWHNGTEIMTDCNVERHDNPLCEYQDPGTGEKWFCVKPEGFPCDSLVYHRGGNLIRHTTKYEDSFFDESVTKKIIYPRKNQTLRVHPGKSPFYTKSLPTCTPGLELPQPSGFYYQDEWKSLVCQSIKFPTALAASACLKGKLVYMFGDSTMRQWWQFLVSFIPSLKAIDLKVSKQSGPLLAVDADNGLLLQWRAHGRPLRMPKAFFADIHYMANDIAGIGGGPDVVICINIWAHFVSFPVEVYIRRLRNVRRAVADLLKRSPQTTVIIKTANTGHMYGSNWLSQQLDLILRKMFSGMQVALVDAWEPTSCHYQNESLHPGAIIIQNEVDMFLSFICPARVRESNGTDTPNTLTVSTREKTLEGTKT